MCGMSGLVGPMGDSRASELGVVDDYGQGSYGGRCFDYAGIVLSYSGNDTVGKPGEQVARMSTEDARTTAQRRRHE